MIYQSFALCATSYQAARRSADAQRLCPHWQTYGCTQRCGLVLIFISFPVLQRFFFYPLDEYKSIHKSDPSHHTFPSSTISSAFRRGHIMHSDVSPRSRVETVIFATMTVACWAHGMMNLFAHFCCQPGHGCVSFLSQLQATHLGTLMLAPRTVWLGRRCSNTRTKLLRWLERTRQHVLKLSGATCSVHMRETH